MPENKDPNHKWHEGLPNDLGGPSTKIVVSVDVSLTIHSHNLQNLIQWVHWQLTVGSQHIRFVEGKVILKRSGWSLIIIHLTQSLSAAGLGCGNSLAVSEYPTVGPISSSSTSHRYSLACIGLLPLAQYCSSPFLTSSLVEQLTWILASSGNWRGVDNTRYSLTR